MSKLTMYVITHKKVDFVPKDRTLIFVGNGDKEIGCLTDSKGDNISEKNPNYCELTAMYWIWKNDTSSDFVSIEHYRRFFSEKNFPKIISAKKVKKILEKKDIITTKFYKFDETIKDYYSKNHYAEDLIKIENIISKKYPEYMDSYNAIMNGNKTAMCNMIIMPKKDFDEYCEWLFNILFELEKKIDIEQRDSYQKRVFGFLSERLQNVWMHNSKKQIQRLPIYYKESNKLKSIGKTIKNMKEKE